MPSAAQRAPEARNALPLTPDERIHAAREVLRIEAAALWQASHRLGADFDAALSLLYHCRGAVLVTGMGKAGLVGQKVAATLASTGATAHFLHPAEAFHGDLGRVRVGDVVLALSQSGETAEVVQLLPSLRELGAELIAVTATATSTLGRAARVVLPLGEIDEACTLGLAPSTSTAVMLALGDALALVLSSLRGFRAEDFARYHPGGALGKRLARVEDVMRPLADCRVAPESHTVRQVLVECGKPGRRTGAVMLVDADGKLTGLFTDSDLARLLERRHEASLDRPIRELMHSNPTTIPAGERVASAVRVLAERKFSELPVVDADGKPLGLVDVTDVVGFAETVVDAPPTAPAPPLLKTTTRPTVRVFPGEDVFAAG
ncbi:MAG: KpsF/GutQ family sugar-phosphate isomerase [Lacipirellulaceae bacterium]